EAGGVLEGEAVGVEGVGGDGFFVGEAEFLVFGFVLLGGDFCEGGDGLTKGGGIGGNPTFGLEFGSVFQRGGVCSWSWFFFQLRNADKKGFPQHWETGDKNVTAWITGAWIDRVSVGVGLKKIRIERVVTLLAIAEELLPMAERLLAMVEA
ncbi:MAG: hypothetical protein ACRCXD_06210, partial [Luteolibacter sp.]